MVVMIYGSQLRKIERIVHGYSGEQQEVFQIVVKAGAAMSLNGSQSNLGKTFPGWIAVGKLVGPD